jgi:hypothetical protein
MLTVLIFKCFLAQNKCVWWGSCVHLPVLFLYLHNYSSDVYDIFTGDLHCMLFREFNFGSLWSVILCMKLKLAFLDLFKKLLIIRKCMHGIKDSFP